MSVIDFSELKGFVPGEHFEAVVREIARILCLSLSWTGRGADEGKDLILTEICKGPLSNIPIKWLVQCKDFSKTRNSVKEADVGPIIDKVKQHKANGYLIATTTAVSTGLMKKLDSLDIRNGGEIHIKVWDYPELVNFLSRAEFIEITKQYLPESYKKLSSYDSIEGALNILKENLSNKDYEEVQKVIEKVEIKRKLPLGKNIWPNSDSAKIIDSINEYLSIRDFYKAANATPGIEYEAFMLYIDKLAEYDSALVYVYLLAIIREITEQDIIFNCAQYLFSNYEISPDINVEILSYIDNEGKSMLLDDEIMSFINEELLINSSDYNFYSYIDSLSSHTRIEEVYIEYINYDTSSTIKIDFSGKLSLCLELGFGSGSDIDSLTRSVKCDYEGFMDSNGIYLTNVEIDESEYQKD